MQSFTSRLRSAKTPISQQQIVSVLSLSWILLKVIILTIAIAGSMRICDNVPNGNLAFQFDVHIKGTVGPEADAEPPAPGADIAKSAKKTGSASLAVPRPPTEGRRGGPVRSSTPRHK